jgi:hypothetical protein
MDHTWVTDYDNRTTLHRDIHSVKANGAHYWTCWGKFRPLGRSTDLVDGFIGAASGLLPLAKCLCKANAYSKPDLAARGTIFDYGFDGVCHQLANQVLWATQAPNGSPLMVQRARGYRLSSGVYGDYGIDQRAWQLRIQGCAIVNQIPDPQWGVAMRLANAPDTFEQHATGVLDEEKADALLRLRQQHQAKLAELKASVRRGETMPSASILNSLNNEFLRRAAALLGPTDFEEVFGIPAGEVVSLVDPELMADTHT